MVKVISLIIPQCGRWGFAFSYRTLKLSQLYAFSKIISVKTTNTRLIGIFSCLLKASSFAPSVAKAMEDKKATADKSLWLPISIKKAYLLSGRELASLRRNA